jgi:hypothetical protein
MNAQLLQTSVPSRKYVHIIAGFSEDRFCRGGPDKWLRVAVGGLNVLIDFLNQFLDAA